MAKRSGKNISMMTSSLVILSILLLSVSINPSDARVSKSFVRGFLVGYAKGLEEGKQLVQVQLIDQHGHGPHPEPEPEHNYHHSHSHSHGHSHGHEEEKSASASGHQVIPIPRITIHGHQEPLVAVNLESNGHAHNGQTPNQQQQSYVASSQNNQQIINNHGQQSRLIPVNQNILEEKRALASAALTEAVKSKFRA